MMQQRFYCVCLAFGALLVASSQAAVINSQQRLMSHIFKNYDKETRPVIEQSTSTNVTFGVELVQMINVNDRYQMITTKLWVRQAWVNQLMAWNPKDWNNTKSMLVDSKIVWTPDIVLYNNAENSFSGGTEKHKTKVILYSDGTHFWLSPATFTSTCRIDITYFPFDRQICTLKFGSWSHDVSEINMLPDKRDIITTNYVASSEWQIIGTSKHRNSIKYACCKYPYTDITIKIILSRKPLYYVFNVIAPCLVLAITILFGFFLPAESGERISLTITILLAVAVFLQLVSDNLPRNSDSIPILSIFYMLIMGESALSLIATCVVLICHFHASSRGIEKPPEWVRKLFFKTLSKFIHIKHLKKSTVEIKEDRSNYENKISTYCNDGFADTYAIPLENGSLRAKQIVRSSTIKQNGTSIKRNGVTSASFRPNAGSNCANTVERELDLPSSKEILNDILQEVRVISDNIRNVQLNEGNQDEWNILAIMLDRIFFWVFLFTLTSSALVTLLLVGLKYN